MKIYLITPVDIKYSYRSTEYHIFEYARYLKQHKLDAEVLITENIRGYKEIPNYPKILKRYNMVHTSEAKCNEYILPFKWHIFKYHGLPKDGTIYFPYSVYDYIFNILGKAPRQKYIFGCHGMHLKMGEMVKDHRILESLLNSLINFFLDMKEKDRNNFYCHALNKQQKDYMVKVFKFKRDNVFTVPTMVDSSLYKLSSNSTKKLVVVHIGGSGKDIGVVVDVIKQLIKINKLGDFEFYFIGQRDNDAERSLNGIKNVQFFGPINNRQKKGILAKSDAMILPAYEAFPVTMLEGLASGLHIFTSKRNASWRDITDLGIKINLSKIGDASEYVTPLLALADKKITDKKAFDGQRKRNRLIAIKEFDEEAVLGRMFEMFEKVG